LLLEGDKYVEVGEDGTPLGEWQWDDTLGEWVYEKYPAAGGLPRTGYNDNTNLWLTLLGISLAGTGIVLGISKLDREGSTTKKRFRSLKRR